MIKENAKAKHFKTINDKEWGPVFLKLILFKNVNRLR